MLQTNLNVIAIGEPNFSVLIDNEKRSFFETLFSRIVEIHNLGINGCEGCYERIKWENSGDEEDR